MIEHISDGAIRTFETAQIKERREQAGIERRSDGELEDLVGLGLSGGGLRSAAYNLGFLQALSKYGVFRYVDYLCSVSGGGYIAGHVAATATEMAQTEPRVKYHDSKMANLGLGAGEQLDPHSYQFRHLGEYLLKYHKFLWRYLLHTSATLLLFAALLGIPCTILALIWRQYDLSLSRHALDLLKISPFGDAYFPGGDEALIAFIPSLLLLVVVAVLALQRQVLNPAFLEGSPRANGVSGNFESIGPFYALTCILLGVVLSCLLAFWPLCYLVEYCFRDGRLLSSPLHFIGCGFASVVAFLLAYSLGWLALRGMQVLAGKEGNVVEVALLFLGLSLAVSLAVFLGNGFSNVGDTQEISVAHRYDNQSNWTWFLLISLVCSLLPLIATTKLAQSAQSHSPPWKKWVFVAIIGFATISVPFSMMFFMARENISLNVQHRSTKLLPADIDDWNAFLVLTGIDPQEGVRLDGTNSSLEVSPLADVLDPVAEKYDIPINSPNDVTQLEKLIDNVLPRNKAIKPESLSQFVASESAQVELLRRINVHLEDNSNRADNLPTSASAQKFTKRLMDLVIVQAVEKSPPAKEISTSQTFELSTRRKVEEFLANQSHRGEIAEQLKKQWNLATMHATGDSEQVDGSHRRFLLSDSKRASFNRLLLEFLFPEIIGPRTDVSTPVVVAADQRTRGFWLLGWLGIAGLLLCVDYNSWSPLYCHYRDELARVCLKSKIVSKPLKLQELKTCAVGAPYPIFLATQFFLARIRGDQSLPTVEDAADAGKTHSFVFSPQYCGGEAMGRESVESYCGGQLNLGDAVAISGAALTPLMVDNIFFSALMAAFNFRIGQWLPRPNATIQNPLIASGGNIVRELVGSLSPDSYPAKWQRALVADGGFHDFFGLEQLLLRRCRIIIISDAGCNNGSFEFGSLADVIRMLRERHGIEVRDLDNETPPDLSLLRRIAGENKQPLQFVCMRALCPAKGQDKAYTALLVYAQMSLTGREQVDLQQFRNSHPNFPDEPIINQFFDASQVESYRQLGFHVGKTMCREFQIEKATSNCLDLGKKLVRAYLAELQTVQRSSTNRGDCRVVDHFITRERWSAPMPLHDEDLVNNAISGYLDPETKWNETARDAGQPALAAPPEIAADIQLAVRRVLAVLQEYNQFVGRPSRTPFVPGGRRALIRAIAYMREVLPAVAGRIEEPADFSMAWLAIAHLVFPQHGPIIATEVFFKYFCDLNPSDATFAANKARFQRALETENISELKKLLTRHLKFNDLQLPESPHVPEPLQQQV